MCSLFSFLVSVTHSQRYNGNDYFWKNRIMYHQWHLAVNDNTNSRCSTKYRHLEGYCRIYFLFFFFFLNNFIQCTRVRACVCEWVSGKRKARGNNSSGRMKASGISTHACGWAPKRKQSRVATMTSARPKLFRDQPTNCGMRRMECQGFVGYSFTLQHFTGRKKRHSKLIPLHQRTREHWIKFDWMSHRG